MLFVLGRNCTDFISPTGLTLYDCKTKNPAPRFVGGLWMKYTVITLL